MKEEGIQFFSNLSIFATLIFIPLIAMGLGASPFQTALIVVAYNLSVFFSNYVFGRGADIYGRRVMLLIGLALSSLAFGTHVLAYDPISLGVIRIFSGICAGMWVPALLAYTFESKKKLGKVMGFGGLGWGIGVLLAGVLVVDGTIFWRIYLLSAVCFFIAFLIGSRLPRIEEVRHIIPLFPKKIMAKSYPAILAVTIRHTGATAIWVLLPVYLKIDLGFTEALIGYTYACNAFSQFAIMYFADRVQSKISISFGLIASGSTFLFFQWAITPIQWAILLILIGAAWSFLNVGGTLYVMERCSEKATATGMLQGSIYLGGIMGPLIGGLVAEFFNFSYNFYIAVILSFAALLLFWVTSKDLEKDGAAIATRPEEDPRITH